MSVKALLRSRTYTKVARLLFLFFDNITARYVWVLEIKLESLILAQNERWRRGLGMQVERSLSSEGDSGERVSNTWVIFL